MGKVIASAAVSVDGFIADTDDAVGPLFDWLVNGDVEIETKPDLMNLHGERFWG